VIIFLLFYTSEYIAPRDLLGIHCIHGEPEALTRP